MSIPREATPTPVRTARVHALTSRYNGNHIQAGIVETTRLIGIVDPHKLACPSGRVQEACEAYRLALMGLAARMTFEHLYNIFGKVVTERVYDIGRTAKRLLAEYPPALVLSGFTVTDSPNGSLITEKSGACRTFSVLDPFDQPAAESEQAPRVAAAKRAVLIDRLYQYFIGLAGDQPRDLPPQGLALVKRTETADTLRKNLAGVTQTLADLNKWSDPLNYELIDRTLVRSLTGLPFNIHIPF